MEQFQKFLQEYGPQQFAISLPIQLVVNTIIMWFVVNFLVDTGGKVSILKCFACSCLLCIVSAISMAMLMYPMTLVMILAFVVWLVGSIGVIHGMFEMQSGGFAVFFVYLFLLLALSIVVHHLRVA